MEVAGEPGENSRQSSDGRGVGEQRNSPQMEARG